MPDIQIRTLKSSPDICATLSEMLVETVENGGSVSFMHPLPFEAANEFWRNALAAADRGERIALGAFDGEDLIGTVTLVLNLAQNLHKQATARVTTGDLNRVLREAIEATPREEPECLGERHANSPGRTTSATGVRPSRISAAAQATSASSVSGPGARCGMRKRSRRSGSARPMTRCSGASSPR